VAASFASQKIVEKGRRLAAHMLEAAPDDIEFKDGTYGVKGSPDKTKTIQEVALAAAVGYDLPAGMEPFLDETTFYDAKNVSWPFGTHVAVVEIDQDTGVVDLKRYIAVDDVGRKINPMIVDGQIHGGIAQGVGQALWEGAVYNADGQLLSGTMQDYALPRASWFPQLELDETITPSPDNPLGVKGVGETGAIASTAAVANAVMNALSPLGISHVDLPLTPPNLWRAIHASEVQQ
jgi:carbon-monoxide dehydrogenase large subunit